MIKPDITIRQRADKQGEEERLLRKTWWEEARETSVQEVPLGFTGLRLRHCEGREGRYDEFCRRAEFALVAVTDHLPAIAALLYVTKKMKQFLLGRI